MTSSPRPAGASARQVAEQPSIGELTSDLGEQLSRLIRDEMRLAQAELKEKGKRAGMGAGLLGGAAVVALYGGGCLVAAAILALSLVLDAWLAALIIGAALLAIAAVAAVMGKGQVQQAGPPVPTEAVESTKQVIATAKGRHS